MTSDHYFTASPASADERRTIEVELNGSLRKVQTASGIFSPAGLDKGTAVLLQYVPAPRGRILDIGCGWGPITLAAAEQSPQSEVYGVDVNERSIDLARLNATALGLSNVVVGTPESVDPNLEFDTIWSNPPIRIGKDALHELLMLWLPRLAPGGEAWMVVQKNLGSDSLQKWLVEQLPSEWKITREATAKAFRVLKVARPA
ncbi:MULTISPECIES: class I SAM-dependent methyltransferase [Micrococcaceae]|uniref:class I SAM-dependent methyltransferase n=1 Tax=Micrococcaceae TaxID=1268 RepID=UPI000CFAA678|nr:MULTISPECIES: methyltransferase [unclassified Arthrobacter]PQZ86250.1 16S rRNA methyltransferase [Arthrobacter sp. MYb222]PRB77026.1 16S rRNA methyltransferase [Arthrobacter sp. MYb214]TDU30096.1 16S rRNA m(2)G 1207 methyltransferase [Arthrobacter sp. JUb115]